MKNEIVPAKTRVVRTRADSAGSDHRPVVGVFRAIE
jgi:endonuclease/exonuclease/phosphatase (EEP) superfamily protein YafD